MSDVPVPIKKRWRKRALATAVLAPLLAGGAAFGVLWALKSEGGSVWMLARVPGLQIDAPQGSLLGDFSARRLVYRLPGSESRISIDGLRWQGLTLSWSSSPRLWGQLDIARLQADRLDLSLAPSSEPSRPPADLALPMGLRVQALQVDQVTGLSPQPLLGLRGSLDLSADGGQLHRVSVDSLQWERLRLRGQASVQTGGSMTVAADLALQPTDKAQALPDWSGGLKLSGPLLALQAQAQLQASGQSLQADALLQPFAAWPLASLQARAERLDLSALISGMPHTALSGEAQLESKGWSEPALLRLRLSNAAAGRWDQQRLPLQSIALALSGRPDQPESLRLSELEGLLGAPGAPGGRISGQGQLKPDQGWSLTARLSGLRPAALDSRLSDLRLDGRLQLSGQVNQQGGAPLQISTDLNGLWQASPVSLSLQASLSGQTLKLDQAQLASGRSRLLLSGEGSQQAGGWRAQGSLKLQDFDPRLLWAGSPGSAWQRSSNALNADGLVQLQHSAKGKTWPQGQVQLTLGPSRLAGVALSGKLNYAHADGKDALLTTRLALAENQLLAITRMSGALAIPTLDTQVELLAPRLASLSPLLALARPDLQLAGAADGKLGLLLRRPDAKEWQASTEGSLNVQKLRLIGPVAASADLGRLRWAGGGRLDSPLLLNAELERISLAGQVASKLKLDLEGNWAEHRLTLGLQGLVSPPAAGQSTATASVPTEAALNLSGRLSAAPLQAWQQGTGLGWQARIARLRVRPNKASLPDWLKAEGLDLDLQLGSDASLAGATLAPAGIELGGARLRWSQLQWRAPRRAGERADVRAELALEPLQLAPLLARWQPEFGWGGALVVGGRASIRSLPRPEVAIMLERSSGDLSVTDERGVQALGLTDLRLALTARDGLWQFTQAMAGTNMGSLGGAVTVHADPQALWPAAGSKLEGVLQANVAKLGTWGAWVPPGWRLGGSLSAHLQMAGTLGAPQLLGGAAGSAISLRNPLLGVDMTEGVFALTLDGSSAKLVSLTARGGVGQLTASGEAQLGTQPSARLQLKAERFVLLNRVDQRLQISGQAALELGAQALQLDGRFSVDEGLFDFSRSSAPSLDSDVYVLRTEQMPDELKPAARTSSRKTRVNLDIDLGSALKLRGRGLDSRLSGELKLTQNDGAPRLTGSVRTVGGTYAAYGQKLDVERGEITFVGPYDNPRLDVQAVRANSETRVGVAIGGTALQPRIKLFSDPEMSDTDKLSWLVLGRAPDGLGRSDTALLQSAALALLSGEGDSTSDKLIKGIGLDELSVMQATQEDDTRGTVVRLGKQLSRRWYVAYERGLNTTTGNWQLIYRIAQRFTLRAQGGEENSLDLIWQWKWE